MDQTISNQQFLQAIFNNSKVWITSFKNYKSPNWAGRLVKPSQIPQTPDSNNYFSVASFKEGAKGRRLEFFNAMHCVVLDDVKNTTLAPSWKLETSPGNFQIGFILSEPVKDIKEAQAFAQALCDQSLVNSNDRAGNNIVRNVRLPVGWNDKNEAFEHVLHEWHPETRYGLYELRSGLGLMHPSASKKNALEVFGEPLGVAELTRQVLACEHFYEPLLKLTSHLVATGMSQGSVIQTAEGIMLAVDPKPSDWNMYFKQIGSMVKGAVKKFGASKNVVDDLSGNFNINSYFTDLTLDLEDVSKMSDAEFLIKDLIVRGHTSVYIAPGNGGKTTLFVHFCEQLAAMGMTVLYVNVDGSPGDLKRHYAHAQKNGYVVIAPDAKVGKSTGDVMHKLESLASANHQLNDVVIIIDTLKKFVDVIAKGAAKEFLKLMRTLTVRGATVCLLGHANKYKDENGRHIFEGTADIRNDVDEMVYLNSVPLDNPKRLQVTTDPDKVRADLKPRSFIIYLEDDRRVEECAEAVAITDPESMTLISLIKEAIAEGNTSQKSIVSFVTERNPAGLKKVKQVLHENTGQDRAFSRRQTGRGKDLEYSVRLAVEEFKQGDKYDFAV